MTAKIIQIDDDYTEEFELFVKKSEGHIKVMNDENLEYDPYFYERKAQLDATIKAVDDGSMQMYNHEEWDAQMKKLDNELDEL